MNFSAARSMRLAEIPDLSSLSQWKPAAFSALAVGL
jgi:hypothetical protein